MQINNLRQSSYLEYEWCQWKFYLNQVLGFQDSAGGAALLGTIVHKVLEILSKLSQINHYKSSKYWNVENLWIICFNHYYTKESEIASTIKNDRVKKVLSGLNTLLNNRCTPVRDNIIASELTFNLPVLKYQGRDLSIKGTIDRIDKINENTLEIFDYKTGVRTSFDSKNREKKDIQYFYDHIQSRIYHLAISILYPEIDNIIFTYYYLMDGGAFSIPFAKEDIVETKNILRRRFDTIFANDDPQRIMPHFKCNMCSFKKDGTCQKVWQEKNELGIPFITEQYIVLNKKYSKIKGKK